MGTGIYLWHGQFLSRDLTSIAAQRRPVPAAGRAWPRPARRPSAHRARRKGHKSGPATRRASTSAGGRRPHLEFDQASVSQPESAGRPGLRTIVASLLAACGLARPSGSRSLSRVLLMLSLLGLFTAVRYSAGCGCIDWHARRTLLVTLVVREAFIKPVCLIGELGNAVAILDIVGTIRNSLRRIVLGLPGVHSGQRGNMPRSE